MTSDGIPELAGLSEATAKALVEYAIGQVADDHNHRVNVFSPERCLRCLFRLEPEKREKYLRIFLSDEVEF